MTHTLEQPRRDAAPEPRPRPIRRWPHRLVPVVLILLGIVVLIYPIVATEYNNYRQQEFARKYQSEVKSTDPAVLQEDLARARAYNATLPPQALLDPWANGTAEDNPAYQAYLGQLNRYDAMGRLRIPSVGVEQSIYHGSSDDVLAKGVGHLYGTTLPVGGPNTHAALTAHSGMTNATMFDNLHNAKKGEVFFIDVAGETLAYRIDEIQVVLPNELDRLARREGADLVTLVTCTPYAVNTHRLLVTGTRIPYVEAHDPGGRNPITGWRIQPWMHERLIGAGGALVLLVGMIIGWIVSDLRRYRRRRRQARQAAQRAA